MTILKSLKNSAINSLKEKVFTFDAETDGLYGKPWAIGAVVFKDGQEIDRFEAKIDESFIKDQWVIDNVIPECADMKITHTSLKEMLEDFWAFFQKHSDAFTVLSHMGHIVEANLMRITVEQDIQNRQWNGVYDSWTDVSQLLGMVGEKRDSVDAYMQKKGLTKPEMVGGNHNPIYDSLVAYEVWKNITEEFAAL